MAGVRRAGGQVHVPAAPLEALVARIFAGFGCSEAEGARIAGRLVGANLRGHDSHGAIRVPRYAQWLRDGVQVADATVDVVMESDVLAVLDGKYGFGQTVGEQAVDIGIAKAAKAGVALVALRNSGHLGRIGDWPSARRRRGWSRSTW